MKKMKLLMVCFFSFVFLLKGIDNVEALTCSYAGPGLCWCVEPSTGSWKLYPDSYCLSPSSSSSSSRGIDKDFLRNDRGWNYDEIYGEPGGVGADKNRDEQERYGEIWIGKNHGRLSRTQLVKIWDKLNKKFFCYCEKGKAYCITCKQITAFPQFNQLCKTPKNEGGYENIYKPEEEQKREKLKAKIKKIKEKLALLEKEAEKEKLMRDFVMHLGALKFLLNCLVKGMSKDEILKAAVSSPDLYGLMFFRVKELLEKGVSSVNAVKEAFDMWFHDRDTADIITDIKEYYNVDVNQYTSLSKLSDLCAKIDDDLDNTEDALKKTNNDLYWYEHEEIHIKFKK